MPTVALWTRFWLCLTLSLLLISLVGCTFYGTPVKVENWPDLRLVEHRVSQAKVKEMCAQYTPWWGTVGGCAIYYRDECHVWAADEWVAAIERDHCSGLAMPYWKEEVERIRDQILELRKG